MKESKFFQSHSFTFLRKKKNTEENRVLRFGTPLIFVTQFYIGKTSSAFKMRYVDILWSLLLFLQKNMCLAIDSVKAIY